MKNTIYTAILFSLVSFIGTAQDNEALVPDQNPNYKVSLDKYTTANSVDNLTLKQGTTVQDTYKAIDPMEAKRERKELRQYYRSQKPLWRQEVRLERAKNTSYYNGISSNFGINYYNGIHRNYHRSYYNLSNRRFYARSLFNFGIGGSFRFR